MALQKHVDRRVNMSIVHLSRRHVNLSTCQQMTTNLRGMDRQHVWLYSELAEAALEELPQNSLLLAQVRACKHVCVRACG